MATTLPMVALLNAFPFCSPQRHFRTPLHSARSRRTTSFVFTPLVCKQVCAKGIKTKRCRFFDISLLRCSGGRWDWHRFACLSPPLAAVALPNFLARSCCTTSFVLISLLSTNKFVYRSAKKQKDVEFSTSPCFVVRVEDGIRTHDLRNHNPSL